jgi:hypothetical protein
MEFVLTVAYAFKSRVSPLNSAQDSHTVKQYSDQQKLHTVTLVTSLRTFVDSETIVVIINILSYYVGGGLNQFRAMCTDITEAKTTNSKVRQDRKVNKVVYVCW